MSTATKVKPGTGWWNTMLTASSVEEETLARGVVSLAESTVLAAEMWLSGQFLSGLDVCHMGVRLANGSFTPEPVMHVLLK